jgi:hypothetical protein
MGAAGAGAWGLPGLGVRLLPAWSAPASIHAQALAQIGTARATRDGGHLLRLLLPRIETIDPGFGIERIELIAARVEPLGAVAIEGALAGERPPPDLAPLIDRLAGRLGARRLYRSSAVESDVPERSVRLVGPLAETRAWPDWPRPVRLLVHPEPLQSVVALLPICRRGASPGAAAPTASRAPTGPSASTANGGAAAPRRKRCATISRWRTRKAAASGCSARATASTRAPATSAGGCRG